MWAVIPPLSSQPVVDLIPDQPSRVLEQGYLIRTYPYIGQPVMLTSAIPHVHAVHFMTGLDPFTDFSICLGPRYRFTAKSYVNLDPVHPFVATGSRYMRATIEDSGSPIATANVPNISNRTLFPGSSGVVFCFGYAFDGSQLKAYAHISTHRLNVNQGIQDGVVPSCGSGTASLIANVDAADALAGTMSLIVREPTEVEPGDQTGWGGLQFFHMACRIGPFLSVSPHLQERSASKLPRAGTRVASLRSMATNFCQPMATGGVLIEPQRGNHQGVANVDCGGHAEFSGSGIRFAVSLAGQPDADTAYVPASASVRGNCGFTQQHISKLAQVTVAVSGVNINPSGQPFFVTPVSFTKTISSDSYGNNEYAGVSDTPGSGGFREWDSIHVQVRISGYENIDDFLATPIQNVVMRFSLLVNVSMFAAKGGTKVLWDTRPLGASASKSLTEAEAEDFFNGGAISLAGGSITITAAG